MSDENDTEIDMGKALRPRTYYLVGMGTNSATRMLRRANRGKVRGRKARIGPFLVRPNRTVPISPEQVEEYADQIQREIDLGRLQLQDGEQTPMTVKQALGGVAPMPDISGANLDELVNMLEEAKGDPALHRHVKAALIKTVLEKIETEEDLEGLTGFADSLTGNHPMALAEIELACAARIKVLRDAAEAAEAAEAGDTSDDGAGGPDPLLDAAVPPADEDTTPESEDDTSTDEGDGSADEGDASDEDEDALPYSEWAYGDLKDEVKSRELGTDTMKKEDLVAALELDDEAHEDASDED